MSDKKGKCQALDMPPWYRGPRSPWSIGTGKMPLEANPLKGGKFHTHTTYNLYKI
jgi:hypothetical protein